MFHMFTCQWYLFQTNQEMFLVFTWCDISVSDTPGFHVFTWQWYHCFKQTRFSKCSHGVISLFQALLGSTCSHDSDISVLDKQDVPRVHMTVISLFQTNQEMFQVFTWCDVSISDTPGLHVFTWWWCLCFRQTRRCSKSVWHSVHWNSRRLCQRLFPSEHPVDAKRHFCSWTDRRVCDSGFASPSQQEWTYAKYVRTLSFVDSTLAGCSLSGVVLTDRAVSLLSTALEVPRLAWRQKPFWFPSSAAGCSSWRKMTWFKLRGVLIMRYGQCMKIFIRLLFYFFKCQLWMWAYDYQCETSLTAVSYSQFLFCFFSTRFIVSIILFVGGSNTQGNQWIWCVQVCIYFFF